MVRMKYEMTSNDMTELTPDQLLTFFQARQEWHRLLEFKSNLKRDITISKRKGKTKKRAETEASEG